MADELNGGSPDGGTPQPTPTPTPTPSPTPPTPTPPPAPAPGNPGSEEDKRFKGITADLAKERKARQQYEARIQQYETELAAEKRRVQALAGVNTPAPEEAEAAEVRERFAKLYPHLGNLTAEEIQEMREMAKERKSLQSTTEHYWKTHGIQMVSQVQKEVQEAYGGDLTQRQKDAIQKAYVLRASADPEFLERHENGDPTLAKEFAKEWVEDWFEPARRKITATQVNQFRPLPNGKDRSTVTQGEKKIDVNNNDQVMDLLVQGRQFTGRR